MTDAPPEADPRLLEFVETWRQACDDFVALARALPREEWDLPTDLDGWSVKDNVAHTAHLEAVLAGAPEETIEVAEAPHLVGLMNYYTEQGVLARRDRDMAELVDEIETAVATRYAELQAEPPTDGAAPAPRTPGGIGWSTRTLLTNRPVDVWMHDQDIRRAVGRPGGYDSAVADARDRRARPLVADGARQARRAPRRYDGPGRRTGGRDGVDRRPRRRRAGHLRRHRRPDATITLTAEDFVVLSGGRRGVEATQPKIEGDEDLALRLLSSMAVTP